MAKSRAVIDMNPTLNHGAKKSVAEATDEVIKEMEQNIGLSSWMLVTTVTPGSSDRGSREYGKIRVKIEYDPEKREEVEAAAKAEADLRNIAQKVASRINIGPGGLRSV